MALLLRSAACILLLAGGALAARDRDIVLALSTSAATTNEVLETQTKPFVQKLLEQLSDEGRVGFIAYESLITQEVGLDRCKGKKGCWADELSELPEAAGSRCSAVAINHAVRMLKDSKAEEKIILLITDGPDSCGKKVAIQKSVEAARKIGISFIVIAYGQQTFPQDVIEEFYIITRRITARTIIVKEIREIVIERIIWETKEWEVTEDSCFDAKPADDQKCDAGTCSNSLYEATNSLFCQKTCGYCDTAPSIKPRGENCKDLIDRGEVPCDSNAQCVYFGKRYNPPYQCWCTNKFRAEAYRRGWKSDPCQANIFYIKDFEKRKVVQCRPKTFDYLTYTTNKCNDYLKEKGWQSKYRCDEPELHIDGNLLCRFTRDTQAFFYVEQGGKGKQVVIPAIKNGIKIRPTSKNQIFISWTTTDFFCNKDDIFWAPSSSPATVGDLWSLRGLACIVPDDAGELIPPVIVTPPIISPPVTSPKCNRAPNVGSCYVKGDPRLAPGELTDIVPAHNVNKAPCPTEAVSKNPLKFYTISLLHLDGKTYETLDNEHEHRITWDGPAQTWRFHFTNKTDDKTNSFLFLGAMCALPGEPTLPAANCPSTVPPIDPLLTDRTIIGPAKLLTEPPCDSEYAASWRISEKEFFTRVLPGSKRQVVCRAGKFFIASTVEYPLNTYIVKGVSCIKPGNPSPVTTPTPITTAKPEPITTTSTPTPITTTTPTPVTTGAPSTCVDTATDCGIKSSLCYNVNYKKLMKKRCPHTCGFC